MSDLKLEVCGTSLTLRSMTAVESGNEYWAVAPAGKKPSRFGTPIAPLADALPDEVVVSDPGSGKTLTIALKADVSPSGNPKRCHYGVVELPNGEKRKLDVSVSSTASGWNLIAKAYGVGGGTTRKAVDVSALV